MLVYHAFGAALKKTAHHCSLSGSAIAEILRILGFFAKVSGYELDASYRWEGLKAHIGMAYSKPTVDGAAYDNIATAVPMGRQWSTGLSYRFDDAHLEIGWNGRYAQRTEHPDKDRNDRPITAVRGGYGVHDIYASWQPTGKDDLNINFAINNVGNKKYGAEVD